MGNFIQLPQKRFEYPGKSHESASELGEETNGKTKRRRRLAVRSRLLIAIFKGDKREWKQIQRPGGEA